MYLKWLGLRSAAICATSWKIYATASIFIESLGLQLKNCLMLIEAKQLNGINMNQYLKIFCMYGKLKQKRMLTS